MNVIPEKAGIEVLFGLDSRLLGNDRKIQKTKFRDSLPADLPGDGVLRSRNLSASNGIST